MGNNLFPKLSYTVLDGTFSGNKPGAAWLQNIGYVSGTPAKELKVGDYLVWNFGETSRVKALRYTKTMVFVTEEWQVGNELKTAERRLANQKIVGRAYAKAVA